MKLPKKGEAKLAARVYEDKTFARCIIFNESRSNYDHDYRIIALENIHGNGGLGIYDHYSAGISYYTYRKLTQQEIHSLPFLRQKLTEEQQTQIKSIKTTYNIDIAQLVDIKKIRKQKLLKIINSD